MTAGCSDGPIQQVRWQGRSVVVDVVGDIDLNCSLSFQQSLLSVLDEKPDRMVVNLAGVPYMDSSGVASLVKLLSRSRKAGLELFLVGLRERVRGVFEVTRLHEVFEIASTEREALS